MAGSCEHGYRYLDSVNSYTRSFNEAISSSNYIESNEKMIANNVLERIWKEAVVAAFGVLSRYLPAVTEENQSSASQDGLCSIKYEVYITGLQTYYIYQSSAGQR